MRMPITEFISSGDLKFIIAFTAFTIVAASHYLKKIKARNQIENKALENYHNSKINKAAFWIGTLSVLSLLLGFMHSLYFIGKAGGIAPNLIFLGASYALITPVMGVSFFIICKILAATFNAKVSKEIN